MNFLWKHFFKKRNERQRSGILESRSSLMLRDLEEMERNGHFHRAVTLLFPRTRIGPSFIDWLSLGQIPFRRPSFSTPGNLFIYNHISRHLISFGSSRSVLSSVFWMRLCRTNISVAKSLSKGQKVALVGHFWLDITFLFTIKFHVFIDRSIALATLYQISFRRNSIKWKFQCQNQSQSSRKWRRSQCKLRHFLLAKQPRIVIRIPLVQILEKSRNKITTFHQSADFFVC